MTDILTLHQFPDFCVFSEKKKLSDFICDVDPSKSRSEGAHHSLGQVFRGDLIGNSLAWDHCWVEGKSRGGEDLMYVHTPRPL